MKVYARLAQAFKDEGVKATFGMIGDGNMMWLSEMHRLGIRVHEVRHEGAGLGMADGWARVTGEPGIATTTCGPGVTQLASSLVVASRARSPLVAFCGEHPTTDPDYLQKFDTAAFASACEAGFVRMNRPEEADEAVRKAFRLARSESKPVILSVPLDLQEHDFDDDDAYKPSTALITRSVPYPDLRALEQAADLIAASRKPVIVVGRGGKKAEAGPAVLKLGERIGALIATSLLAKTYLNEDPYHIGISGNYASRTAIRLLQESDCVIAVGAGMNRFTTEHGYLYADAKFIHIDLRPDIVTGGERLADCYIVADAKVAVETLDNMLAQRGFRQAGNRTPETAARLKDHLVDRMEIPLDPDTVDPRIACEVMDEMLPGHIGIVSGSGMIANMSNMTMLRQRPVAMASHFFGCIGQMFPVSMGAIAATGIPMVLVNGDASTMMHIGEFETAVRYRMPLCIVVMNNEILGPEYYNLEQKGLDPMPGFVSTPDIGHVARGMGGRGHLVTTVDRFRAALKDFVDAPGPMIIDLRVSRTVLPVQYRRLYYGMDV